ncbi:MAG TPA: hypothetical protein VFG30_19170 [Polyangiales bacterium]|nr:hypothetical protein [Polyangiales bacterium]
MAKFKGTVFESTRMFTVQTFGEDAVERVLAELDPSERDLLRDVQAISWYPVEPILHYMHALDRVYGQGDLGVCIKAGHYSAGWSMNTVLKVFLRFRSPVWLVDRATSVWNRYHDTGKWHVQTLTSERMLGELRDFAVRDPAFCARLCGWLQGAIELTGGDRATVTEVRCMNRNDDHCAFALEWKT